MHAIRRAGFKFLVGTLLTALVVSHAGCVAGLAQLIYMVKGQTAPAEFPHLKGKRVAIVCISDSSAYGPDRSTELLERFLAARLQNKVKKIDVVHHQDVHNWLDTNDFSQINPREIGRGVNADMVVAVQLSGYKLHEGQTLYKGHANVTTEVYDLRDKGKVVFRKNLPDFQFPVNGARPSTGTTEAQFEQTFIHMLSEDIANYFYDYEYREAFGRDAAMID